MNERTGEIRKYEDIPVAEQPEWSKPFHEGEIIDFKGVKMKIIRIKKMRKQVWLEFAGK